MFLHNPPGEGNALKVAPDAPAEIKHEERELVIEEPEINPFACILLLLVTVGITAATAEFVSSSMFSDMLSELNYAHK